MKSLATLEPQQAGQVAAKLNTAGIACESLPVTEESGVAATELLVEETAHDAACAIVEMWLDDQARKTHMVCPKCQSSHLEPVPHDSVEVLFRCKDCGEEILAQA